MLNNCKHVSFVLLGQCSFTCLILQNLISRGIIPLSVAIEDACADQDPFKELVMRSMPDWFVEHLFYHRNWKETVVALCNEYSIPYLSKKNIISDLPLCDVLIVGGYASKIPEELLNVYGEWAINIHPSILPMFRGPQPEAQIILNNGSKYAGVTLHRLTDRWDSGAIYFQKGFDSFAFPTVGKMESVEAAIAADGIEYLLSSYPSVRTIHTENSSNDSYYTWYDEESVLDVGNLRISDPAVLTKLRLRPEGYAYYRKSGTTMYPIVSAEDPDMRSNASGTVIAVVVKNHGEELECIEDGCSEFLEAMGI